MIDFVGLFFPDFGSFSLFYLAVLVAAVALFGYFNNAGINNLAGFGENALIIQRLIESIEESFDHLFLNQCFTELPDRLAVRNAVTWFQTQKPFETQSIGDLVFHLVIRQIVEALQDKELEHHQPIKRRPANIVAVLGFIEDHIENRSKELPIDMVIEFDERVFELCEFFEQKMIVKKAEWVDVFHNNRSN